MDRIRSTADMDPSLAHNLHRREKPEGNDPAKWIVAGSIVGATILAVLGFAFFLHFRRRKGERLERQKDLQELDDYGLAENSRGDDDEPMWPQRGQSSMIGAGAQIERRGQDQQQQQQSPQQQPHSQQQQQQQQQQQHTGQRTII